MKTLKLISNKGNSFKDAEIIIPNIYKDDRGYFYESWNKRNFDTALKIINFCQENRSFSKKNVLRGLHFQTNPHSQGKLVECILGKIYDVILDLRTSSDTFMQWGSIELSEENKKQIWIGKGFAHGFYTLSNEAHVLYKTDNYWDKNSERTIIWNDSSLSINWPLTQGKPLLSDKDLVGKEVKDLTKEELF